MGVCLYCYLKAHRKRLTLFFANELPVIEVCMAFKQQRTLHLIKFTIHAIFVGVSFNRN